MTVGDRELWKKLSNEISCLCILACWLVGFVGFSFFRFFVIEGIK